MSKRILKIGLGLLLVAALVAGIGVIAKPAAANGVEVYFRLDTDPTTDPATGGAYETTVDKQVDDTWDVGLWLNLDTVPATGADAYVRWDKTYLEVTNLTRLNVTGWTLVKIGTIYPDGDEISQALGWTGGYLKVSAGGITSKTGDIKLATITFKAKATTASTTVDYFTVDPIKTKIGAAGGAPAYNENHEGFTASISAPPDIEITTPASDPQNITAGTNQSFVATLVSGGPVDTANYKWDFDYDGVTMDTDATGLTPAAQAFNTAGTFTVRFTAENGAGSDADTVVVNVQPAAADYLTVTDTGGNNAAAMTAGGTLELLVKAFDQYDNLCSSGDNVYAGSKNLTFSGLNNGPDGDQPQVEGVNFGTPVSTTFTAGVSSAGALTLQAYKAETASVDVADNPDSTGDAAYDLDLTVNVGAANKLVYTTQPDDTVGATVDAVLNTQPVLEIRDSAGNLRSTDTTSVTLNPVLAADDTTAGTGTLIGTATKAASGGVVTFANVGYTKAGEAIHLKATAGGLNPADSTQEINLDPGALDHLKVTESGGGTSSATITAGNPEAVTVTAYDQYDNVLSSGTNIYAGAKNLDFSGPTAAPAGNQPKIGAVDVVGAGTLSVTFTAGVSGGADVLVPYKAETVDLDVEDTDANKDSTGDTNWDLGLTVNADADDHLVFDNQPTTLVVAGATWDAFTINILDQYDNVTASTANVSVTTTSNAFDAGTATKAASGGQATFNDLAYYTAETVNVNATSGALTGAQSNAVVVEPGVAHHLKVTESAGGTSTAAITAGDTLELTVKAYDEYDNLLSSGTNIYQGSKNLTFTGPAAAPAANQPQVEGVNIGSPVAVNFTAGVSDANTATLTAYKAETVDVDVADNPDSTGDAAWDLALTVNVAALDAVVVSPADPTVITTDTQQFTAVAHDLYDNPITATFTWSVLDAQAGNIDANTGLFTAGTVLQTFAGAIQAETTVTLTKQGTTGVTVDGATITCTAQLQGDNRVEAKYDVPLTFKLYDEAITFINITTATPVGTFTTTGGEVAITNTNTGTKTITFTVVGLPVGNYNLTLYTTHCLVNYRVGVDIAKTGTVVDMGELLEGDAVDVTSGSTAVDITDFSTFAAAYNSIPTGGNWNTASDFDRDEYIGIVDFSMLYTNYGKLSPQTVGG